MKSGIRFSLVLSVCLLLIAPCLIAQTTGTIEGQVTDQNGGALPGASVEATSPNLQGSRAVVTGSDGRYRLVSLPPGSYKVTANLSGFGGIQKNATVSLDSTATVNLQMQLAAKEAVIVTGEAPLVDTSSTSTGTSYNAKVIEKLPVGRNYASIVFSQPGVQTDYGETQGRSLAISIYGGTSAENLFLIDGVNTTNVIKGFQGKSLNTEFVQEVEVKTGGYQAEYGRNTGGVINVITKSGGNEFHGDVFAYFNNKNLRSDYKTGNTADYSQTGDTTARNVTDKDTRWDYGLDLGGYFIKDRLWFFGAYDRLDQKTDYFRVAGVRDPSFPPTFRRFGQLFPLDYESNLYSGKLTFNVTQGTSIVGSVFGDPQENTGAINTPPGQDPLTYTGVRKLGGLDWAGRVNQLFGSFGILTAQYGEHKDRFLTEPANTSAIQIRDRTVSPLYATGGFGSVFGPTVNNESKRQHAVGSFTLYIGPNELKVGGDYEKDQTFGSTFYSGGQRIDMFRCGSGTSNNCVGHGGSPPTVVNAAGQSIPVFFSHQIFTPSATDQTPLVTAPFDVNTKRYGAFLQDQLRIGSTLTVNAGVRWDQENVVKGNGETAFKLVAQWSPRFGFVWDFVGDGTSKVYGSYGRFYYSLPTDLNARVFTANTQVINYNYSSNAANILQDPKAPRNRLIQVGTFDGEPVDVGTKASYQDEYTIGVEKALDPTFSVGIKGTYRTLGRTVEDRCDLDYNDPRALGSTCAIMNPGGSGPAANGDIPTCDTFVNSPTNGECGLPGVPIPEARRIFRGIEVTARKAFSQQLWAQASYLYSSLRGNYSGAIREASGQTDPGINADYDYWQFGINAYGKLELDRPHQFRVDAVYNAPFGLAVGLQAYVRSGQPKSRLGFYNAFYPDLLYLDQRGSNGRQPTEYEANLSLAYNINIGKVTVTPQLYIFNLLNKQEVTATDDGFNTFGGSWISGGGPPFYGTAGVPAGGALPAGGTCPAASAPCPDNPNYNKAFRRNDPRLFRAALKITF